MFYKFFAGVFGVSLVASGARSTNTVSLVIGSLLVGYAISVDPKE